MTALTVVTDSGPLIYLAVLGCFVTLRDLFGRVYLPETVYREVVLQGAGEPGADETRAAVAEGWLVRVAVENATAVDALLGELDEGEAEAIVLARELNADLVLLDDGAARAKARLMSLRTTGTIGVLLLARDAGMDVDLRRSLDTLVVQGFWLSRELYEQLVAGDN